MNQPFRIVTPLLLGILISIGCGAETRGPSTRPVRLADSVKEIKFPSGTREVPTLTPYPVKNGTGAAVVVIPGGGYGAVMDVHEGEQVCRWFNDRGTTAFLLRYRVAPNRYPSALDDAQRAIRVVRAGAKQWHVDPNRVGVIGFSAGGHLAASTATLFHDTSNPAPATRPAATKDDLAGVSDRPDFAVLVYPVISLVEPHLHRGSRDNLLGKNGDPKLARELSLERRVTDRTPPCFLVHGKNDKVVDVENSEMFADALKAHGVKSELVELDNGPHGFGIKDPDAENHWLAKLESFLKDLRVVKESAATASF